MKMKKTTIRLYENDLIRAKAVKLNVSREFRNHLHSLLFKKDSIEPVLLKEANEFVKSLGKEAPNFRKYLPFWVAGMKKMREIDVSEERFEELVIRRILQVI